MYRTDILNRITLHGLIGKLSTFPARAGMRFLASGWTEEELGLGPAERGRWVHEIGIAIGVTRKCKSCERLRPLSDYYLRAENGRLHTQCKACIKAQRRVPEGRRWQM